MQCLLNVWALYNEEQKIDEELNMPEKLKDRKNVRAMLEDLENYLMVRRGATGLPLAYVTRKQNLQQTIQDSEILMLLVK